VQQIDKGGDGDEDKPEPDEQKDLLVEEVDGQDALDCVTVDVHALLAEMKVTESNAWKALGQRPVQGGRDRRR